MLAFLTGILQANMPLSPVVEADNVITNVTLSLVEHI
jgi:hypothetical protein